MGSQKCSRSLSGMVYRGFHKHGDAEEPPGHLPHTLRAKPQALNRHTLLTKPGGPSVFKGAQSFPLYLGLLQVGSTALRLVWGCRTGYPSPSLPCSVSLKEEVAAGLSLQTAPAHSCSLLLVPHRAETRPATRVAPMATTELPPEGRGKRWGHS